MKHYFSRFFSLFRVIYRIPNWMGEHPFFGFLVLLFLALLIASVIFYQYAFREEDSINEVLQVRFDQQKFQRTIDTWKELEQTFNRAGSPEMRDIFAPQELTPHLLPAER